MTDTTLPPAKRPIVVWDVVLTIVFLVLGVALVASLALFGVLLVFASDSCTAESCNTTQLSIGIIVAVAAPIILFVIAVIVSIVQLVRRRLAFWIPLVGAVLAVLGWGAGFLMVGTSVDGFFG